VTADDVIALRPAARCGAWPWTTHVQCTWVVHAWEYAYHLSLCLPRPQCVPPSYRCVRNLSPSTAKAAATEYTHINVAIVTRSHFGNAKPKFLMNCWPTISINDRSCQQRCTTGPANILTCTYSFIFTIYKSTCKQQRNTSSVT